MGAWDYGPFDNDGALDLLGELDGVDDVAAAVTRAMREMLDADDYIEGPDMSGAVAVACLVAARRSRSPEAGNASTWLTANPFDVSDDLRKLAAETLERALRPDDNELYDLWAEAEALDIWTTRLQPYRTALR
ncbi:protein of unknown function [Sinosporangium album]|uniref:DUF4259 domain-containing protein n=1 Tax=Sinosporangium album TaxID=504805 RepID=A0A1G8GH21_9ACTN|nr:DUF4259 domain-containing protein [Sinosporangium album]SDH93641.1 protein of unknown function [Sinosporangium album]